MLRAVLFATALLLGATVPAAAAFLVPLIAGAAFAATAAGVVSGIVLNIIGGFAISHVASLIRKKPDGTQQQSVGGVQLDIRIDALVPQSLVVGRAVTAGSLVHAATFGRNVDSSQFEQGLRTDLIEIIGLADHPCDALEEAWIDGQEATLAAPSGDRGQEVTAPAGYVAADGSKDLAIKFYDGTQVAADTFAVDRLGADPDHPWTANHIGTGITYVRVHSVYNAQRVTGRLRWKFVVRGIKLYDPRLDTTVGGSGSHRFDDLSTHEWTDNLAVIAYNILRGIYVEDSTSTRRFFYGLENTDASQLPLDNWFAAMNEADVVIDLENSPATEPQFTAGGEITVDTEPREAIQELLKASGGRLTELGGIYKLYLGAPGVPVLNLTDGDIRADAEDQYKPILGLEKRINYITGSYTSPVDGWVTKAAPPRSDSDWETEDGRRLPADLTAPLVQSGTQMQRLMQQMLLRSRQQRKHVLPLSRIAFILEPGDVISWTSTRNGYVAKYFEVDDCDYDGNLNTTPAVTEVDPADYDWVSNQELPEVDGALVISAPTPKIVYGFAAVPFTHTGTTGVERPGIKLTWTDPEDGDVTAVLWQLRVAADPTNVTSGRHEEVTDELLIILSGLAPETNYEVRGKFESFEGYPADWSLWIAVTTPAVNELTQDDLDALEVATNDLLDEARARVENLAQLVGQQAQLILQQNDLLLGVQSFLDETNASGMLRIIATTAPDDALAAIEMQVRAQAAAAWATAAIQLLAYANVDGTAASRIRLIADSTQIGQPGVDGGEFESLFEIGSFNGEPRIVARTDIFRDDGISTKMIQAGTSATVAYLEDSDQDRTYNAWNNAGAGEEFSTLNFAINGDGIVIVKLRCIMDNIDVFVNSTGHFISIEANAVEVFRIDIPETVGFATSGYMPPIEFAIETLPAGSNTLVAKLCINDTGTAAGDHCNVLKIGWLVTEHRKPGVQAGGAVDATVSWNSPALTSVLANDQVFSTVAIGTASAIRRVVLGVGYRSSANNVTGITGSGSITFERIAARRPSGTPIVAQLWLATVPTGTTIDLTLATSGGGVADLVISVWSVTSAAEAQVDAHTGGSVSGASPVTVDDLEIQMGGAAITFAYGRGRNTFAFAWTGADSPGADDVEADIGSDGCHYAGSSWLTTESTEDDDISLTHAATSGPAYVAIVAASWR